MSNAYSMMCTHYFTPILFKLYTIAFFISLNKKVQKIDQSVFVLIEAPSVKSVSPPLSSLYFICTPFVSSVNEPYLSALKVGESLMFIYSNIVAYF